MHHTRLIKILVAILVPLLFALMPAKWIPVDDLSQVEHLLMTTFACSLGMAMPISTPPNTLSYGNRLVHSKDMIKVGSIIGITGLALAFGYLYLLTAVLEWL